jgi:hypothetical protein
VLIATIAVTTVLWIAVAYLSPATDNATLRTFYEKVRPAGPGWKAIREQTGLAASTDSLPAGLLAAALGAVAIWSALFATGSFLYSLVGRGVILAIIAFVTGAGCVKLMLVGFAQTPRR